MNTKVVQEFPDELMIRDTLLHDDIGGAGQRIYTTAGQGYKKVKYIRADLAAAPAVDEANAEPVAWIPVTERLPKTPDDPTTAARVLVIVAHGDVRWITIRFFRSDAPHQKWWSPGENEVTGEVVTHWMPLPQPPLYLRGGGK